MSEQRTGSGLAQGPLPTGPPRSGSGPAGQEARLCPEMASFRALVLDFVRDYIARWGQSPSYGEIAAGLASNRTRVKRALRSLELAGLLLRRPGTRGISLPGDIEQARLTLERAGLLDPGSGELVVGQMSPVEDAGPQGRKRDRAPAGAPQRSGGSSAEDGGAEAPPQKKHPITKATLLPPAVLDYSRRRPRKRRGKRNNGDSGGSGGHDGPQAAKR